MRIVYASTLQFRGSESADQISNDIAAWITQWYEQNASDAPLPRGWADGAAFSMTPREGHSLEAQTFTLDGTPPSRLREFRWRYPDFADASLVWSAEATVFSADDTLVTLVLRIASVKFELLPARFQLGTPRIIRTLVARGDARIGEHPVALAPTVVEPSSVPLLVDLLLSKTRQHPIIVISPDTSSAAYSVDAGELSGLLAGVASVHVLSSKWSAFALTDEVGKAHSCYNGAVRIYWPRFALDADASLHRLWPRAEALALASTGALARSLVRAISAAASFRFVEPAQLRAFRRRRDEARLAAMKESWRGNYDELFDEWARLDGEARQLREQLEVATRDNEILRDNLATAWVAPQATRSPANAVSSDDPPDVASVHDAVRQAQQRTRHLVYLDDAFSSARESPFKQPTKAYSALMAVEEVARRWTAQLDGGPKLGPRKEAFRQLGFDYKDDISQTSENKWGDEYSYLYDGKKTLFAGHITIGAKQPDKCLSLHMHWDEARRSVVIGHVGRHKTNTRT